MYKLWRHFQTMLSVDQTPSCVCTAPVHDCA